MKRKKDFAGAFSSGFFENYQFVFKDSLNTPRNTAKDLGLTKQRVIQIKKEALKAIKSELKSA